jgi:hypothetical protein
MNLRRISIELSRITARIDNFTMLGATLMADQRKLLDIALSTPPNTISEPTKRDENVEQTLWNAIDQMCREMTEQKLFFENKLAESKAEADQASARHETKLEEMRKDFEDLRVMLTSKIPEMESKMSSLAEQQLAERRAERGKSQIEQTVAMQRKKIDEMSKEISALTLKIDEMADQKTADQLSKLKDVNLDEEMYRRIDLAFKKTNFRKTEEKIRIIYAKSKKNIAENQMNLDSILTLVKDLESEKPHIKNCFPIFGKAKKVISQELNFPDSIPSLDYIQLVLIMYEYNKTF